YPGKEVGQAFQPDLQCLSFVRGNGVINEAGCWDHLVGMTLGAIHVSQVPESGWPLALLTRNPSPRAGASGNETRVASVRNPKSRIENPKSCVGPSAIPTGSRTRPSDWGRNGRFGLVEDRRNNHKACQSCLYSPDLVAVTFHLQHLQRDDFLRPGPLEPLEVQFLDELREREFPRLLLVVVELAEFLGVHSQLARHLKVHVRQVMTFLGL